MHFCIVTALAVLIALVWLARAALSGWRGQHQSSYNIVARQRSRRLSDNHAFLHCYCSCRTNSPGLAGEVRHSVRVVQHPVARQSHRVASCLTTMHFCIVTTLAVLIALVWLARSGTQSGSYNIQSHDNRIASLLPWSGWRGQALSPGRTTSSRTTIASRRFLSDNHAFLHCYYSCRTNSPGLAGEVRHSVRVVQHLVARQSHRVASCLTTMHFCIVTALSVLIALVWLARSGTQSGSYNI
ncbi:hypothetical protein J6590_025988 [Homalodisca vitripennis]|nr:hypothetical protein J6590_025988 [Homalodisca vitripennis]